MTLCCIERAASFVLHHVSRKTCLIAITRHRCDLLTVRPHHRTDPEALHHARSTDQRYMYAVLLRWYYWNCVYSTRNGISGSFSIEAICSNIYPRPAWRCRRRCIAVISIYIVAMCTYVSVLDPLARRKPWGPATAIRFQL